MNGLGISLILKSGCFCLKENIKVNGIKYRILDRLGDGGFSVVDLIENSATKKIYALKRIKCHSFVDENRVKKEIEYLKLLQHPNILELIDYAIVGNADMVLNTTSDGFIILQYYPQGTLHDLLQRNHQKNVYLSLKEIISIFKQICNGVKCMHSIKPEPLAHRDLKTANICLKNDNTPVIIDFGSMSKARIRITDTQERQKIQDMAEEHCSVAYRAPELFNVETSSELDERTDIWSLGCMLYALCYFQSPFEQVYVRGDSVALAVLSGSINFPSDSQYPEIIHDLILFMLNVNAQERPFIDEVIEKCELIENQLCNSDLN